MAARSSSAIAAAISTPRRPTPTASSWKTRASCRSWVLTVGGIRPKTLSVDEQAYFKVQFFEAVTTGTIYVDSHLSVVRRRARHHRLRGDDRDREPRQGAGRSGREAGGGVRLRRSVRGEGQAGQGRRALQQGHGRRADARLQARHLRARDGHQGRQEGRGQRRRVRVPASRSRRSRPGRSASTSCARGRRADIEDIETPRRKGGTRGHGAGRGPREVGRERPAPGRHLGSVEPHLPAQPDRSRGAALRDRHLARARCRRRVCPGSWRSSAATACSPASRRWPFAPELAATTLRALAILQARTRRPVPRRASRARSCTRSASAR